MDSLKEARVRAEETSKKKELQARENLKARADYDAEGRATRLKTERLKALRLAQESLAQKTPAQPTPKKAPTKAAIARKSPRKKPAAIAESEDPAP